jgi:outer membrane protein assembly factor BamB
MKGLITIVSVALFAPVALAADTSLAWPQFRGPGGSGVAADDQKPPVEFGPDKNVKWKIAVPSGPSSPIIAGDKIVITAFDDGKLYTIAYNRADGKEAWRADAGAKEIEKYLKSDGSPAASTPATDGKRIVSYFGSCGLRCYDLSGKELWRFELPVVTTWGGFGSGTSPILADGTVVLVHDEMKGPKIIAVDVVNGTLKWEKARQSRVSYSTPTVWDTPAGKQVVVAGHARMIGYDLKTGSEEWSLAGIPSGCCASPAVADGHLFFAGWAPGGADDKDFQMPTFDALHKQTNAKTADVITKEEAEKHPMLKDGFDIVDANKDGKLTREEWDTLLRFIAEGKNAAFALKSGGKGELPASNVLWKKTKGLPYIPSALVYQGQMVMVKDLGLVTAYDAKTGKDVYVQERVASSGKYYASPVAANGHIYFTELDDGVITVLKAGADKPTVVSKNPKLGERTAATPAIADDTLYVRTAGHLYAFGEKK